MEEGADEKLQREVEEQLKLAELERLMMQEEKESGDLQVFNSQAVGLDSWVRSALKSILRETLFLNLKFIFTSIFEIKIHEKKILDTKKISFLKADFYETTEINMLSKSYSIERKWISG